MADRRKQSVEFVVVRGVKVWSRYHEPDEMALLVRVVEGLPRWATDVMRELWCDSQWGSFAVEMEAGEDRPEVTRRLGALIAAPILRANGGHYGIYVGETCAIDPNWEEGDDPLPAA